jgi:putative endonuclease
MDIVDNVDEDAKLIYFVYILTCADRTLYTGITNDLESRVAAHNNGKGAKYTLSRLPVTLSYKEACDSKSAALKREAEIKRLTRAEKLRLVATQASQQTGKP